jgi:hypothetical protein
MFNPHLKVLVVATLVTPTPVPTVKLMATMVHQMQQRNTLITLQMCIAKKEKRITSKSAPSESILLDAKVYKK